MRRPSPRRTHIHRWEECVQESSNFNLPHIALHFQEASTGLHTHCEMASLKEHSVHPGANVARATPDGLDIELVPGTEIFTDLGSTNYVHGSNDVVLVPQPHDDIHDPLVSTLPSV